MVQDDVMICHGVCVAHNQKRLLDRGASGLVRYPKGFADPWASAVLQRRHRSCRHAPPYLRCYSRIVFRFRHLSGQFRNGRLGFGRAFPCSRASVKWDPCLVNRPAGPSDAGGENTDGMEALTSNIKATIGNFYRRQRILFAVPSHHINRQYVHAHLTSCSCRTRLSLSVIFRSEQGPPSGTKVKSVSYHLRLTYTTGFYCLSAYILPC